MDFKNSWTGKIVRYIIIISISVVLCYAIIYKLLFMPMQKNIQKAEKITNVYTTVLSEPKGSLFNSDNELLWGFLGIKFRLGKPVREKLNGEQNK